MKSSSIAMACFIGLAILQTGPAAMDGKIRIFHASPMGYPYYSSDSAASKYPPGSYFALSCGDSGCVLKPAVVEHGKAVVHGHDLSDPNGDVIRVKKYGKSLFLIRGLPGLAPGPVRTIFFNRGFQDSSEMVDLEASRDTARTLEMDGHAIRIHGRWEGGRRRNPDDDGTYIWKVESPTFSRTIATLNFDAALSNEDALGAENFLLWAGDIDRDGKVDFLVRPQARADYLEMSLFLSSQFKVGAPWAPAARFYWWNPSNPGC